MAYSVGAVERAMKVQEIILRALSTYSGDRDRSVRAIVITRSGDRDR